jgi:hypothetical protein
VTTPTDALQQLIVLRVIELVARDNNVRVTPDDIAAEHERFVQSFVTGGQQLQSQNLARLITQTTAAIRPIVNANGGSTLPNPELQTVVAQEIERMRQLFAARGTQIPIGPATLSERTIEDQVIAFRNALATHGVGIPPQDLELAVADLLQQLNSPQYTASDPDHFQQIFNLEYGDDQATYQQILRIRVILEKLRPQYAPDVEALVLQELRTDSQAKAQEAIQKGRAGTPFSEILRTYQVPGVPPGPNDNTIPTSVILADQPALQKVLPVARAGEYSEPIATADGSQFLVYRIVRVEVRPRTDEEANALIGPWYERISAGPDYAVVYVDESLRPPPVPR